MLPKFNTSPKISNTNLKEPHHQQQRHSIIYYWTFRAYLKLNEKQRIKNMRKQPLTMPRLHVRSTSLRLSLQSGHLKPKGPGESNLKTLE